jgi:hypothetical protein
MRHSPLLNFSLPDPPQIWLVVFIDPPNPGRDAPWPNRLLSKVLKLLRPGFRHVLAASPVGGDDWLICNPGSCHLGLDLAASRDVLHPVQAGMANGNAHCVTVTANRPAGIRMRGLFTCVNIIAHLIGTDCHPCSTPYGLFKRIAAMQQ